MHTKRNLLRGTRVSLSLVLAVLVFSNPGIDRAAAHDPQPVSPEENHRPSPLPDRIVLSWEKDPAHSQSINWRTDTSVHEAFVEYAKATPGPYFTRKAQKVTAGTEPFESNLGKCHYHSITLEQLSPETKYVYRVGDGVNWSEWFQFKTASDEAKPFHFIYFGDAQNEIRSYWSRVIREANQDAPRAAFMLHAGDLINRAEADAEWGDWFRAGAWLNGMIPSIATPGNHEYTKVTIEPEDGSSEPREVRRLSHLWRPQFVFPQNGIEGLEESVYWLDYQGVRIISLNSMQKQEEQVPWLESVLENNPNRWTIVTHHYPIYSAARGRDNPELRKIWKPLYDKYQVDLVLQGHDHAYARSGLDVPDNVGTGLNIKKGGTVYVVSVSGPKMYEAKTSRPFIERTASGTQLYQIIYIDGDSLKYEARTATGELYDAFTLNKRDGERNELIEQVPDTPEHRKPE